ncbi:MAG TPA: hypothetical protein VGV41_01225 [Pseudolabrys sp.]|jgi:hypothetical protein|uniref:hypothetical protein n=1 Tax=Pseudolabrys sp. TaxID=1960880 RepID=UPI002DDDAA1A|nr:hypothetical protein [Pseudolabrys sp.]HEV2627253.1 hypothetical protein [Pseudolabrys sp.]
MPQADSANTTSRRSFLLSTGSAAVLAVIPAAALASSPDQPIFDLEPAFRDAKSRFETAFNAYNSREEAYFDWKRDNEPSGDHQEWQERADAVMQALGLPEAEERHTQATSDLTEILNQVAATPATTLEGLIAKARMADGDYEVIESIHADLLAMDERGAV